MDINEYCPVITSYSIHYTKLYDLEAGAVPFHNKRTQYLVALVDIGDKYFRLAVIIDIRCIHTDHAVSGFSPDFSDLDKTAPGIAVNGDPLILYKDNFSGPVPVCIPDGNSVDFQFEMTALPGISGHISLKCRIRISFRLTGSGTSLPEGFRILAAFFDSRCWRCSRFTGSDFRRSPEKLLVQAGSKPVDMCNHIAVALAGIIEGQGSLFLCRIIDTPVCTHAVAKNGQAAEYP